MNDELTLIEHTHWDNPAKGLPAALEDYGAKRRPGPIVEVASRIAWLQLKLQTLRVTTGLWSSRG